MVGLAKKRKRLRWAYVLFAPLTCFLAYVGYYCLANGWIWSWVISVIGGVLLILAVFCVFMSIWTITRCQTLMKNYRIACQQDLQLIFNYMNQRYAGSVNFSHARSTHRANGKVQLGIAVTLMQRVGIQGSTNQTNGATNMVQQQQVVQGIPVQLPNGQIAYAIQQPNGMPMQIQQGQGQAQGQPQVIQVMVPQQQGQQGQGQTGGPPVYQPPTATVDPHGKEGDALIKNDGQTNNFQYS